MKFKTSYIQRLEDKTTKEIRNKKTKTNPTTAKQLQQYMKRNSTFPNRKDLGSIENDKSR